MGFFFSLHVPERFVCRCHFCACVQNFYGPWHGLLASIERIPFEYSLAWTSAVLSFYMLSLLYPFLPSFFVLIVSASPFFGFPVTIFHSLCRYLSPISLTRCTVCPKFSHLSDFRICFRSFHHRNTIQSTLCRSINNSMRKFYNSNFELNNETNITVPTFISSFEIRSHPNPNAFR